MAENEENQELVDEVNAIFREKLVQDPEQRAGLLDTYDKSLKLLMKGSELYAKEAHEQNHVLTQLGMESFIAIMKDRPHTHEVVSRYSRYLMSANEMYIDNILYQLEAHKVAMTPDQLDGFVRGLSFVIGSTSFALTEILHASQGSLARPDTEEE
jgi:hypothetical protein